MKTVTYTCDRCKKETSSSLGLDPLDFDIKHGKNTRFCLPSLEHCCNECQGEIYEGITKLFQPIKREATNETD